MAHGLEGWKMRLISSSACAASPSPSGRLLLESDFAITLCAHAH